MTWFAFQGLNGGQAIDLAGVQEKTATAEGFHGYGTQADAEATPNSVNFLTRYVADLLIADYKTAIAEKAQPGGVNASNPAAAAQAGDTAAAKNAANAATGGAFSSVQNALSGFYDVLTNGKMWRSLGWLLLGIVLMFIGVWLWIGKDVVRQDPVGMARGALGL